MPAEITFSAASQCQLLDMLVASTQACQHKQTLAASITSKDNQVAGLCSKKPVAAITQAHIGLLVVLEYSSLLVVLLIP